MNFSWSATFALVLYDLENLSLLILRRIQHLGWRVVSVLWPSNGATQHARFDKTSKPRSSVVFPKYSGGHFLEGFFPPELEGDIFGASKCSIEGTNRFGPMVSIGARATVASKRCTVRHCDNRGALVEADEAS